MSIILHDTEILSMNKLRMSQLMIAIQMAPLRSEITLTLARLIKSHLFDDCLRRCYKSIQFSPKCHDLLQFRASSSS